MKPLDLATQLAIPKLPVYLSQIEKELVKTTSSANPNIKGPIQRLIGAGSKRLRPTILLAVVSSQGKAIDKRVIVGCTAVELVHIGSLVHDDIIDEAKTRWNIPTINSQEGVNNAILAGDFLFAKACQLGASLGSEFGQIIASTIAMLVDGESLELADKFDLNRTVPSYENAIHDKTAVLMSAACRVGGLCCQLSSQQVNNLAAFGEAFGMSFQLIDDLLDLLSSTELSGKPVGNDVREGVYTLPVILSLLRPNAKKLKALILNYKASDHPKLVKILLEDGSIKDVVWSAKSYNQSAKKAISKLRDNNVQSGLSGLPDYYLNWALDQLVDKTYRQAIEEMLHQ